MFSCHHRFVSACLDSLCHDEWEWSYAYLYQISIYVLYSPKLGYCDVIALVLVIPAYAYPDRLVLMFQPHYPSVNLYTICPQKALEILRNCFLCFGNVTLECMAHEHRYQEILTDPSYAGQFVLMTCPHIGNTGVNLGMQFPHPRDRTYYSMMNYW
jgi:hypothetical protein